MVYPRHGDVFYLRAILLHRSAHNWIDLQTVNGVTYGSYQEAARALGLFDNRDEGIMAFEELLEFGAPPSQLRWIFALLAVEGSPALIIWEAHEDSLGADIRDRLLRTTDSPPPEIIRNELLLALQTLLQGLGNHSLKLDFRSQWNVNKKLMLNVSVGVETQLTCVLSKTALRLNRFVVYLIDSILLKKTLTAYNL
jgi:hypothetical protein